MQELERITAHRGGLDTLVEELARQLQEVQVEREEPLIAERVLNRLAEQDRAAAETATAVAPASARVVLLIPHRSENPDEAVLPGGYRRILRSCGRRRPGAGQGCRRGTGSVAVRGKLEPLRAKVIKLAGRGWPATG